jgi:hypothetical protein
MRGRPLLEFLVFVLVWGALLVPLRMVTLPVERAQDDVALPVVSEAVLPTWVHLRFSEAPASFALRRQGEPVWEEADPDVDQEYPVEIKWDEQGDFVLVAQWETEGRRAIEVRVAQPVGPARSVIVWHEGRFLEEALLF